MHRVVALINALGKSTRNIHTGYNQDTQFFRFILVQVLMYTYKVLFIGVKYSKQI